MATNTARAWTIIGYPGDSLPENYNEILSDKLHLCYAESPVHDADLNGDGSEKKVHIHFVFTFEGKKSYEQMKEIADMLHAPEPRIVRNMRSMIRYLVHYDNPEKHQYKEEDIICHGGFDIGDYFKKSSAQYREVLKDIQTFCQDNGITEFYELADACMVMDNDWFELVTSRFTLYLTSYLKSRHFAWKEGRLKNDNV